LNSIIYIMNLPENLWLIANQGRNIWITNRMLWIIGGDIAV
jgi:hypothetical protein